MQHAAGKLVCQGRQAKSPIAAATQCAGNPGKNLKTQEKLVYGPYAKGKSFCREK